MTRASKSKFTGPKHARLYHFMLDSPAWRSLSVYSRALYVELERRYNGHNNGGITFSHREAQVALGCSNKPIPGAFAELQERGFIIATQKGSFHWKTRSDGAKHLRATEWTLTAHAVDLPHHVAGLPTKDFMKWQSGNKSRHAESVPLDRSKRTMPGEMTRPKRTNGTPKAGDRPANDALDGTPKAGTYSVPYQGAAAGPGARRTTPISPMSVDPLEAHVVQAGRR